jgi:hypothetical protein
MTPPDFDQLADHLAFQRLCGDLLIAEGCCNLRGPGTGADQGADLLLDVPAETPLGRELVPYIVQCKWNATGNNVGASEISDVLGFLSLHRAIGLLIITSSDFSGTAVTKANAIDVDTANPYRVKLWNGVEVRRRLRRHPSLTAQYWFQNKTPMPSPDKVDLWPLFNARELAAKFGPPPLYRNISLESFPVTQEGIHTFNSLKDYAVRFGSHPPLVTIITGAIGSGKTSFAWSLLNERRKAGALAAGLEPYDVTDLISSYVLRGDERLPPMISAMGELDFLLLDDFGYRLGQHSDTQILACRTMVDVVEHRIKQRRPTLLTIGPGDRVPEQLVAYVNHLQKTYPQIDCGAEDLRLRFKSHPLDDGEAKDVALGRFAWLSKGWLGEKLKEMERELADAIMMFTLPEVAFAHEQQMFERTGIRENREQQVLSLLRTTLTLAKKRREWIEQLPWRAIRFEDEKAYLETDDKEG